MRSIIPAPETQGFQEARFTIWDIPADGSLPRVLSTITGVFLSAEFSPDLDRVAFYRNPYGNHRELYVANADGSGEVLYDAGDVLEFWGWARDSAHFVYRFWPAEEAWLGQLCGPPTVLTDAPVSGRSEWLDGPHFLFLSGREGARELRLGTRAGASTPLATLKGRYSRYLYR